MAKIKPCNDRLILTIGMSTLERHWILILMPLPWWRCQIRPAPAAQGAASLPPGGSQSRTSGRTYWSVGEGGLAGTPSHHWWPPRRRWSVMTAPVMRRVDFHWLLAGRGAGWWDLELEHTLWAQQSRVGYWLDLEGQYDVYIRIDQCPCWYLS